MYHTRRPGAADKQAAMIMLSGHRNARLQVGANYGSITLSLGEFCEPDCYSLIALLENTRDTTKTITVLILCDLKLMITLRP